MDIRAEVRAAAGRIGDHVRRTPVEFSHDLSAAGNCRAHLKLENLQLTGSFKLRGALNRLLALDAAQRARGVVAASTGNHGAGVACAAGIAGCRAIVFAPENAAASKLAAVRAHGAEVRFAGRDCVVAERAARAFAAAQGLTYVSPYNDPLVIAGQGTVGLELAEQLAPLDAVLVAVGGGGLIAGVGGYLKAVRPGLRVIGCSPVNSAVLQASLEAGRILDLASLPTLSDGTAGGLEAGAITFELCRGLIDEFVLVTEEEIAAALRWIIACHHTLIEGAAAVPVAAFLKRAERFAGQDVAIVLCGAGIDPQVLKEVL